MVDSEPELPSPGHQDNPTPPATPNAGDVDAANLASGFGSLSADYQNVIRSAQH